MHSRQWSSNPTTNLLRTLLELGDATSRNLEFVHRPDVSISYGEESITEQNLLELRRRHWPFTHVRTFNKREESKNGADWEWHVIGRVRTLKMRVQAKRNRQDNRLMIKYRVRSTGIQQHELLVEKSLDTGMKPVYCIYCSQTQRKVWKSVVGIKGVGQFHTGCLLVDARCVPCTTTHLRDIESRCVPWHYLCMPKVDSGSRRQARRGFESRHGIPSFEIDKTEHWSLPSVDQLNGRGREDFDSTGVHETNSSELQPIESGTGYNLEARNRECRRLSEHGVHRWVVTDVRRKEHSNSYD